MLIIKIFHGNDISFKKNATVVFIKHLCILKSHQCILVSVTILIRVLSNII